MRDMYLEEVKSPEQSKYPFDYFKLLATIPAEQAFRPLKDGGCPRLQKRH
jgi:branched-chain amino acid transport system substrate-binding protein